MRFLTTPERWLQTMKRAELVRYLDEYLRIDEISDYGPQGLQI